MTEEQLDFLRFKLGGDWYDTWWCSAFDWITLFSENQSEWLMKEWREDFFDGINKGWLEMYPPKKLTRKEYIQQFIDGNYD